MKSIVRQQQECVLKGFFRYTMLHVPNCLATFLQLGAALECSLFSTRRRCTAGRSGYLVEPATVAESRGEPKFWRWYDKYKRTQKLCLFFSNFLQKSTWRRQTWLWSVNGAGGLVRRLVRLCGEGNLSFCTNNTCKISTIGRPRALYNCMCWRSLTVSLLVLEMFSVKATQHSGWPINTGDVHIEFDIKSAVGFGSNCLPACFFLLQLRLWLTMT